MQTRHQVLIATVVTACALVYALTIVASYLANGLDAVPLAEVGGGAYDPKDQPFPPSDTAGLLGGLAILLTPFTAAAGVLFVGTDLLFRRERRPGRSALGSALVLVLCVSVLAGCIALRQLSLWWLD